MSESWDVDISALDLSDVEKNGLQVFRNYSRAFELHKQQRLSERLNAEDFDVERLQTLLQTIVSEESRLLPIVACAYSDDLLDEMYRREVPNGIPGGKDALFGPYGPLSSLASRIKLAYCFKLLSPDVLIEIDRLRIVRNRIAHGWDLDKLKECFTQQPITEMLEIEKYLDDGAHLPVQFYESLDILGRIRIRIIWLICRLTYEVRFFPIANSEGIAAINYLYGENAPKGLSVVAGLAVAASRRVIANAAT